MRQMYGGVCGIEAGPGAVNMPTGWTVEILDTMEPGAGLTNEAIPDTAPPPPAPVLAPAPAPVQPAIPAPVIPSTPVRPVPAPAAPPVRAGSCVCNAKGAEGCVDGKRAICNSASGVDQTSLSEYRRFASFVIYVVADREEWDVVGGTCLVRCARRRTWEDIIV